MSSDLRENPYSSPDVDESTPPPVPLSLRQSCWKYAKLGAFTAFAVMGLVTLCLTALVVLGGVFISSRAWDDAPAIIGGSLTLLVMTTMICGVAGAMIGGLL